MVIVEDVFKCLPKQKVMKEKTDSVIHLWTSKFEHVPIYSMKVVSWIN